MQNRYVFKELVITAINSEKWSRQNIHIQHPVDQTWLYLLEFLILLSKFINLLELKAILWMQAVFPS